MAIIEGIDDQVLFSIGTVAVFCGAVILWTAKASTNNRFTVQITPDNAVIDQNDQVDDVIRRPSADDQAGISQHIDHDQRQESNFTASSHQTMPTFLRGNSSTTSSSHDINAHDDGKTTVDNDSSDTTSNLRNRSRQQTENDPNNQTWTIKIMLLSQDMRTVRVSPTSTIQQLKQ